MEREQLERIIKEALVTYWKKPLIIAGNWKMNMTIQEGRTFLKELGPPGTSNPVILFPPYTTLGALAEEFQKYSIGYGPQNFHEKDKGAFTGEISLPMIKELGCKYLMAGHSERRQYYNETDESVNRKVLKGIEEGFCVMVCIGENLQERRDGSWKSVLKKQVEQDLKGVTWQSLSKVILAYEPIWAIGTGVSASKEEIEQTHGYIKEVLKTYLGSEIPVLYGGSVNEKNAQEIGRIPGVDGFLIGGASLKPAAFKQIIQNT